MKKYRLKQWYPSLHKNWITGDVVVPWEREKVYYHVPDKSTTIYKTEVENNPDFWELVKEPLFITEDGVKHLDKDFAWGVNTHNLRKSYANYWGEEDLSNWKVFKNESNADEHILLNKPFFSINDISDLIDIDEESIDIETDIYDKLKQLAIERSKE